MRRSRLAARVQSETPSDDETMAMVYVGDVYSLVAQEGSVDDEAAVPTASAASAASPDPDVDASSADDDLRPYLR